MLAFLLIAILVGAFGLCPLSKAKHPVDRQGLRHYSVILSDDAPRFELDRLRDWARNFSAVDPSKIGASWSLPNSTAFPVWLSSEGLLQMRNNRFVRHISEAPKLKIHPMETATTNVHTLSVSDSFLQRKDWGQMRVQQKIPRNLATKPAGLFDPAAIADETNYPSSDDPISVWNWDNVPYAVPNTGSLAHIWVADSGINYLHQEFIDPATQQSRVIVRVDCTDDATVNGDCVPSNNQDMLGHGTHVAGSAAGRFRGIAPGATIGSLRIFNNNTDGDGNWAIAAVYHVINNKIPNKFNILSMSIGGDPDPVLNALLAVAWDKGIAVVVAAGNEGDDACNYSPSDASEPVGADSLITVGAIAATDNRASFSNYGICTKIFAPGVQIHSAWINSTSSYNTIDGTSMATPIVSGSLAVTVSRYPGFIISPTSARNMLYFYATSNAVNDTRNSVNKLVYAGN